VKLSKNVGEHNAIMAGLRYVEGDWALIMDDDFQNPPKEGLKLINFALENNYDIVYGDYEIKRHNIFRNLISKINDITANYLLKKPKGLYLSSFKCIKKKLLKNIILYKGPFPYIDGLVLSLTSNIGSLKTEHAARISGKSGYSLSKLLKLYGNLAINFSTTPIHIFSLAGFIIAGVSGLYGIFIFLEKFLNPTTPIGYSSLLTTIVFFSGIQLIFLGLIGEYVGKILKNVNQEKQYNIDFEKLKNGKK
jgi:undecaprenyl-phosphate 4-deoxy-4-formamido-L-arabinose transferase